MSREPHKLLVVGGGSAGWMAAAYIDAALNRHGRHVVDVSLVESPSVARIGVGEATIPSIRHILDVIGIDEREFLKRVDGTFKQAIRYDNWLDGAGETYYHPFNRYHDSPIDRTGRRWLTSDRSIPFAATVSAQPALCDMHLAPQMLGQWDFGPPLSYAYHMNALKFADYLCELATSRGVTHHLDHVIGSELTDNGDIAAVLTRTGRRLEADIFIDCTGFAAELIEKKLGVKWVDCSQWLLNDQAITMAVPYEHYYPGHVRSCTTATALAAGWVWEIPLQDKRSLGYVHSSQFISEEEAERQIRAFEGPHADSLDTRLVTFKVGHREKAWVRNCIAIGLAGSFIEPLESTGLYLSDLAAVMLTEHFPHRDEMEAMSFRFNRIMANRFYEILDFINLHYCLTRRSDTEYWREVQRPERIHERLQAKLDFWRIKPPSPSDFEDQFLPGQPQIPLPANGYAGDHRPPIDTADLFGIDSYEAILYGMDFLREECAAWYGRERPPSQVAAAVAGRVRAAPERLPPHDVWLARCAGMKSFPGPKGGSST